MKVRVKETGEIINIADYARVTLDKCDSYGNPIELSFDGVEILQERSDNIDWEQRRYEIAKSAMQGLLCAPIVEGIDPNPTPLELARAAVRNADALIKELKENNYANNTKRNLSNS